MDINSKKFNRMLNSVDNSDPNFKKDAVTTKTGIFLNEEEGVKSENAKKNYIKQCGEVLRLYKLLRKEVRLSETAKHALIHNSLDEMKLCWLYSESLNQDDREELVKLEKEEKKEEKKITTLEDLL